MLHVQSMAYWAQHRFPVIVTVPGNIYGPYDNFDLENAHVVPALIRKFVEAGERSSERLVVWGIGAADARLRLCRGRRRGHPAGRGESTTDRQLVNLASGQETSIRSVVDALREISGFRGEVVWDADAARRPVPSRL